MPSRVFSGVFLIPPVIGGDNHSDVLNGGLWGIEIDFLLDHLMAFRVAGQQPILLW